jgi:hypothetical protein
MRMKQKKLTMMGSNPNDNFDSTIDFGDEIEQEPNPNDNSDSTIDFVSNSIKDMVDDTTIIHPSNFLCPPPLSYFTFSHVSLGFGYLSPPMTIQKCGHSSLMSTKLDISVVGLPLIVQISRCFEQSATPHVWDTTTYDPGGSLIHSNYNLEDKVVVDEWSNDTCINKLLLLLLFYYYYYNLIIYVFYL